VFKSINAITKRVANLSPESKEKGRKQKEDKQEGLEKTSEGILNRMMEDDNPRVPPASHIKDIHCRTAVIQSSLL